MKVADKTFNSKITFLNTYEKDPRRMKRSLKVNKKPFVVGSTSACESSDKVVAALKSKNITHLLPPPLKK